MDIAAMLRIDIAIAAAMCGTAESGAVLANLRWRDPIISIAVCLLMLYLQWYKTKPAAASCSSAGRL